MHCMHHAAWSAQRSHAMILSVPDRAPTRFACLFLRSTKVLTNTETVLALRGRSVHQDQGRLNLWLCLVLTTLGLTQPLPSPIDLHCLNPEFVQLNV